MNGRHHKQTFIPDKQTRKDAQYLQTNTQGGDAQYEKVNTQIGEGMHK